MRHSFVVEVRRAGYSLAGGRLTRKIECCTRTRRSLKVRQAVGFAALTTQSGVSFSRGDRTPGEFKAISAKGNQQTAKYLQTIEARGAHQVSDLTDKPQGL